MHNVLSLHENKWNVPLVLALILLQYIAFSYSGIEVNGHRISGIFLGVIFAFQLFWGTLKLKSSDILLFILLFFPLCLWDIVQFFVIKDVGILIKASNLLFNVIAALVISKNVGFVKYTMALRYLMLCNVIIVIVAAFYGSLTLNPDIHSPYAPNLILSIYNCSFSAGLGSFSSLETIRTGGLCGHPNQFGIMTVAAMVGLSYTQTSTKSKIFWWSVFLLSFIVSESRAAILFLIVFYLCKRIMEKKDLRSIIINSVLLLLAVIGMESLSTLRDDSVNADITSGRAELLGIALSNFSSALDTTKLMGVGLGNAGTYLMSQYGFDIPIDNAYVLLLLEIGYLGTLFWMGILLFLIYYTKKHSEMRVSEWLPFFISLFIYSLFEHGLSLDLYSLHWMVFLYFMISYHDTRLQCN